MAVYKLTITFILVTVSFATWRGGPQQSLIHVYGGKQIRPGWEKCGEN